MKISLDRKKCTGLGICESLAPEYFEVDDAGDLIVLQDSTDPSDVQAVEDAVAGCPTAALKLLE